MNFDALLQEIVEQSGGGIGAALMGNDGISIAQVGSASASQALRSEDISNAGAEFSRILEEIRHASDAIGGGAVLETTIVLDRVTLIFRSIDAETFLVVAIASTGNLGKARYLIRRQLQALRQAL